MDCRDIYRIQKGNECQAFTKSRSWRVARGKTTLSFSIHGRHAKEDRVFAIQVSTANVRNILVENFELLLMLLKSDADGEFPNVAQRVIAQHFALTGDILTLHQVEVILLQEEEERRNLEVTTQDDTNDEASSDGSDPSDEEENQDDILG